MPGIPTARPAAVGFEESRLEAAFALLKKWCDADKVPGAAVCGGRRGRTVAPRPLGTQRADGDPGSGKTVQEFVKKEIFEPLGMADTSMGWQPQKKERVAQVRQGAEALKENWTWNSPYWLGLGAPWGGMVTSPADFARFCQMM